MFRCGSAILLFCSVLSAGAGLHPLPMPLTPEIGTSALPLLGGYSPLHFVSAYKNSSGGRLTLKEKVTHFHTQEQNSAYMISARKSITINADVTLFHSQGQRSQMYEIQGGLWPCSACVPQDLQTKYPALAKKHIPQSKNPFKQRSLIAKENLGLQKVGQLLDYGKDVHNSHWTIVRDMRVIPESPRRYRRHIRYIIASRMGMTVGKCQELYEAAYNAALQRMEWYVRKKQMLHEDVNTVNVLFDGEIGDAELIDWGTWKAKKLWEPEVDPDTKASIAHMRKEFIDKSPRRCAGYIVGP